MSLGYKHQPLSGTAPACKKSVCPRAATGMFSLVKRKDTLDFTGAAGGSRLIRLYPSLARFIKQRP